MNGGGIRKITNEMVRFSLPCLSTGGHEDEDDEDDHALCKVIKGMLESWSTVDVNSLKHLEAILFGALPE